MGIRPFSWGRFGIVPDPPEPADDEREYIDDWERYADEDGLVIDDDERDDV